MPEFITSNKSKYCSGKHVQKCVCALDYDVKCFSCVGCGQQFKSHWFKSPDIAVGVIMERVMIQGSVLGSGPHIEKDGSGQTQQ